MLRLGYFTGLSPAMLHSGVALVLARALGAELIPSHYVFVLAIYWALYLGDRIADDEETLEPDSPADFAHRHRRPMVGLLGVQVALVIGSVLVDPTLILLASATGLAGLTYFVRWPGLGRAKDVPLLKSFYAPAVVMIAALGLAHSTFEPTPAAFGAIALGFFALQSSDAMYDLKDLASDRRQGVITLATALGQSRFSNLQMVVLSTCLLIAILLGSNPSLILCAGFYLGAYAGLLEGRFGRRSAITIDGLAAMLLWAGMAAGP